MQLTSYLEGGPLMWMMALHLHVNQKSDYDDDENKRSSDIRRPPDKSVELKPIFLFYNQNICCVY